jgi:hypothetical protein
MPENQTPDANVTDEEANEAVTAGTKRPPEEDTARVEMGGFRRSESAEPIDAALEEAKEEEQAEEKRERR